MEFPNQQIRKVPIYQSSVSSSSFTHPSQSLLVYKSRLTSESHSQSNTGGGGNDSKLQQHSRSLEMYVSWHRCWLRPTTRTSQSHSHTGGGNNSRLQQQQQQQQGGSSQWDEMPRDILIKIFKLLPYQHALKANFYPLVCKSWLYAAVDIIYPPFTTVIDLRFLSSCDLLKRLRFMVYLKLMLDTRPQTQWTALYLPVEIEFSKDDFLYIAQRTPCLEYLDWPYWGNFYFYRQWEAISSWKNLKRIDLGRSLGKDLLKWLPSSLACNFNNLRSLRLVGHRLGVEEVSEIIKALFPQLEYFSLQDSSLTMDAASLVVSEVVATNNNSHQVGIQTLDLRHCAFISIRLGYRDSAVNQRFVQAEIHEKAASAIKTYLRCEGLELCSQCKLKHPGLWHSFYRLQKRMRGIQSYVSRPPQVLVKKQKKYLRSSSSLRPTFGYNKEV